MIAAQVETSDARDGGHENDSEERADVEDQDLFPEAPGEGEKEEGRDAEDDVAANFCAGSLLVGREAFCRGDGQRSLLDYCFEGSSNTDCLHADSFRLCGSGGGWGVHFG